MDANTTWAQLGNNYPDLDPSTRAAFDVLAPLTQGQQRSPIFEWGHETTPTPADVWNLATKLVVAVGQASE